MVGGDHARRAILVSTEAGRPMLLCISKVVRHRICSRPFEKQAACVALGDVTATDVAGHYQQYFMLFEIPHTFVKCRDFCVLHGRVERPIMES